MKDSKQKVIDKICDFGYGVTDFHTKDIQELLNIIEGQEKEIIKRNDFIDKLEQDLCKLEKISGKATRYKEIYHTKLTILIDEIHHQMQGPLVMLSSDLDLPTLRFFEGQRIVLQRLQDCVNQEQLKDI